MLHHRSTQRKDRRLFRLIVGVSLLTSHLLSATALAPIVTTLLALADRTHHLVLQPTSDGIRVVLHHDRGQGLAHHHGLVAQVLTSLAPRPASGHPDHILHFVTGTPEGQVSSGLVAAVADSANGELALSWPPATAVDLPATVFTPVSPRPPPSHGSGALQSVRSIVLLI